MPLAPAASFNIVPLDDVAEAVATLAEHPRVAGQTFPLVVAEPPSNQELVGHITGRFGLAGVTLVDPREGRLDAPIPLESRIERMLAGYREYLQHDARFDDEPRRVLDPAGVGSPSRSAETFERLIDEALGAAVPGKEGRWS